MAARRAIPLAVLLLLAALVLAGCSSKPPAGGAGAQVVMHDFKFDPATITVKAGGTVTFTNHDAASHTATADGGAFDTGALSNGQSKTVTLSKAGTYAYHCGFHSAMTATIVVE